MKGPYIDKWEVLKSPNKVFSTSYSDKRQRILTEIFRKSKNELTEIENLTNTLKGFL